MSEDVSKPNEVSFPKQPWRVKAGRASQRKTECTELAPVAVSDIETDSVVVAAQSLGFPEKGIEELAVGALKAIGTENGELTERGLNRVRGAVKFLSGLLGGKKHREAMADAGLVWAQVGAFTLACPEFEKMYNAARAHLKHSMGMSVLDTALEMATEGSDVYYKGEVVGKKKSEKMLDKLLVLAGKEFSKDGGRSAAAEAGGGGGIVLNFHFDGKKASGGAEVVDV